MTKHFNPRRTRGIAAVRANAGDPAKVLAELDDAVTGFMGRYDSRLDQLERGIDDIAAGVAAARIGGCGPSFSDRRAGAEAFTQFLRTGDAPQGLSPQASMRESSNPDGGYAVPVTIDATIQDQLVEFSPLRRWANVVTLGAGVGTYSFLVNRRGTASGWVGEEEARPETDTPEFAKVTPAEGELYANAKTTQFLLDDAQFDMQAFVTDNIIDEFAIQEGSAFVDGDGVNKPRGFLTMPTSSDDDADRAFGTLQYTASGKADGFLAPTTSVSPADCLVDLVYSLKPAYRSGPNVGWMLNSETAGTVRKFKDADGRFIWQDSLREGQPPMLLGYPVATSDDMPAVAASAFPVAFGNWRRGYRIIDRLGTRILRDPYTDKPFVHFYVTKRVGGMTADTNAIKLLKIAVS